MIVHKLTNKHIKCAVNEYIHINGGKQNLTPSEVNKIKENLQWQFRNISANQLTYAHNYMNSITLKNN